MRHPFKKRFGLVMAAIGGGVAAIARVTGTLDGAQLIASTVLVVVRGIVLYLIA